MANEQLVNWLKEKTVKEDQLQILRDQDINGQKLIQLCESGKPDTLVAMGLK